MSRSWCKQPFESYRWVPENAAATGTFDLKIMFWVAVLFPVCLWDSPEMSDRVGDISHDIFLPGSSLRSACIPSFPVFVSRRCLQHTDWVFGLLPYPPTLALIPCRSSLTLWKEQGAVASKIPHLTEHWCCSAELTARTIKHGQHQDIKLAGKIALIRIQCYQSQTDTTSLSYTVKFCNAILVLENGSWKLAAFDITEFKDLGIILPVRSEFLSAHPNIFPRSFQRHGGAEDLVKQY